MKRAFLVSATALLFAISGWLRASYSYTTLYGGPGAITSGSWDANYWGEVALTLSAPGGCVNTSVSWHDLMFSFSPIRRTSSSGNAGRLAAATRRMAGSFWPALWLISMTVRPSAW